MKVEDREVVSQSLDGVAASRDLRDTVVWELKKERDRGIFIGRCQKTHDILWQLIQGDAHFMYRGVTTTRLTTKMSVEGGKFSNSPFECTTIVLWKGGDKHELVEQHGQAMITGVKDLVKTGVQVDGTKYCCKFKLGGDMPFVTSNLALCGHSHNIFCGFCEEQKCNLNKIYEADEEKPVKRTFRRILELAHMAPLPFTCPGCGEHFPDTARGKARAAREPQTKAEKDDFNKKHKGVKLHR